MGPLTRPLQPQVIYGLRSGSVPLSLRVRRRATPQKDKKDSEIRFTSGLPEMGRKLPSPALCLAIYLSYRYPISALWHVMLPRDPFNLDSF